MTNSKQQDTSKYIITVIIAVILFVQMFVVNKYLQQRSILESTKSLLSIQNATEITTAKLIDLILNHKLAVFNGLDGKYYIFPVSQGCLRKPVVIRQNAVKKLEDNKLLRKYLTHFANSLPLSNSAFYKVVNEVIVKYVLLIDGIILAIFLLFITVLWYGDRIDEYFDV